VPLQGPEERRRRAAEHAVAQAVHDRHDEARAVLAVEAGCVDVRVHAQLRPEVDGGAPVVARARRVVRVDERARQRRAHVDELLADRGRHARVDAARQPLEQGLDLRVRVGDEGAEVRERCDRHLLHVRLDKVEVRVVRDGRPVCLAQARVHAPDLGLHLLVQRRVLVPDLLGREQTPRRAIGPGPGRGAHRQHGLCVPAHVHDVGAHGRLPDRVEVDAAPPGEAGQRHAQLRVQLGDEEPRVQEAGTAGVQVAHGELAAVGRAERDGVRLVRVRV
jgi:hypothetical protein